MKNLFETIFDTDTDDLNKMAKETKEEIEWFQGLQKDLRELFEIEYDVEFQDKPLTLDRHPFHTDTLYYTHIHTKDPDGLLATIYAKLVRFLWGHSNKKFDKQYKIKARETSKYIEMNLIHSKGHQLCTLCEISLGSNELFIELYHVNKDFSKQ